MTCDEKGSFPIPDIKDAGQTPLLNSAQRTVGRRFAMAFSAFLRQTGLRKILRPSREQIYIFPGADPSPVYPAPVASEPRAPQQEIRSVTFRLAVPS